MFSAFALKIVAVISMLLDHSSYLIFGKFSYLNYIGRIAFPIFAYQITEGYTHTHNLKKYFSKLCIFALISQIPFMLFTSIFLSEIHLNIFFTLALGLGAIIIYDKLDNIKQEKKSTHIFYKIMGILSAFVFSAFSEFAKCDYGYFGVLVIFSFYLFRNNKFLMNFSFIILVFIFYGKNLLYSSLTDVYLWIIVFTISALFFINLYNHKKGKDTKYFLYLFYPMHLLIIYLLYLALK
ncbi:MAG: conjugal transfer protein TraX [Clostridia bacterium]|jgi:hypothetical protein|nr:conjugal transfer protein TraX [Clostridia bacterium]